MTFTLRMIAGIFLALFAGIWLWVAWKLLKFEPTMDVPRLAFTEGQASAAGLLSDAFAAATASVLGIEIQKARTSAVGAKRRSRLPSRRHSSSRLAS
jgi:hypothetical protein